MIDGLIIGLREGVEAALIVGIVVAYLVRAGHPEHLPKVWAGVIAAILASALLGLALWVALGVLPSPYEQIFEGTTMLVATAVVTWMLFWMRAQSRALRGHIEAELARALDHGGGWGLAVLAFTSVIREGIETTLFLFGQVTAAATPAAGGSAAVVVGAIAGLIVASGIGYAIYRGSRRLNLRTFFTWTGAALVFVAAGLVSRAVHEFIEVNVVAVGTQTAFNVSGMLSSDRGLGAFLNAVLGYSSRPEVVTLVVWAAYVVAVLGLFLLPPGALRRPRAQPT